MSNIFQESEDVWTVDILNIEDVKPNWTEDIHVTGTLVYFPTTLERLLNVTLNRFGAEYREDMENGIYYRLRHTLTGDTIPLELFL